MYDLAPPLTTRMSSDYCASCELTYVYISTYCLRDAVIIWSLLWGTTCWHYGWTLFMKWRSALRKSNQVIGQSIKAVLWGDPWQFPTIREPITTRKWIISSEMSRFRLIFCLSLKHVFMEISEKTKILWRPVSQNLKSRLIRRSRWQAHI